MRTCSIKKAGTLAGKSGSRSGDGEGLVIPNFGITRIIPNKEDIPKFIQEPLQYNDFLKKLRDNLFACVVTCLLI